VSSGGAQWSISAIYGSDVDQVREAEWRTRPGAGAADASGDLENVFVTPASAAKRGQLLNSAMATR